MLSLDFIMNTTLDEDSDEEQLPRDDQNPAGSEPENTGEEQPGAHPLGELDTGGNSGRRRPRSDSGSDSDSSNDDADTVQHLTNYMEGAMDRAGVTGAARDECRQFAKVRVRGSNFCYHHLKVLPIASTR